MEDHDDAIDPEFDPNRQMKFDPDLADPELWDMNVVDPDVPVWYRIDPSKIKTVKDIALLLDAINIKFIKTHEDFDKISHLLKEEKK